MHISSDSTELLVQRREAMGLTQEDLARRTGLSVRMISDLERGRTRKPHPRSLQLLTTALELDPSDMARLASGRAPDADPAAVSGPPGKPVAQVVVPQQIPMAARHFAGRDRELRSLTALLEHQGRHAGLAVIDGPLGVGKTALAVRWAHQHADRFPDGQLYVNLRGSTPTGLSPDEAVADFLDSLGVQPDQVPAGLPARSALLRSLLAGKRMLLVLDDARSAEQVSPLLPGAAGCLTLVTSRRKLVSLVAHHGAHPVSVDVLSFQDARASLEVLLGHSRVVAEEEATAELIKICRRSPLALSTAGAHAALHPSMRITTLVAQLPVQPGPHLPGVELF